MYRDLEAAECVATQRAAALTSTVHNLLERDRRLVEKDYSLLLNSLSYRMDTLGIRSPTALSSNRFWDEYLKTGRQLKTEKKQETAQRRRKKMAPAATTVTGLDTTTDESGDERIVKGSNNLSGSDDEEGKIRRRRTRMVVPASAPPGGRDAAKVVVKESEKPTTADPNAGGRGHSTKPTYSLDDPEFDDENRRRLRQNAMSAIGSDQLETAKKSSHPFIKKMILAKIAPPKTLEDENTAAIERKKAERVAKERKAMDKAMKREMQRRGISTSQKEQEEEYPPIYPQQPSVSEPLDEEPVQAKLQQPKIQVLEGNTSVQRPQGQIINPIFLDEKKGQELYRVLIQQEIKWTRRAVSESARRNRLSAKKEFSFFP